MEQREYFESRYIKFRRRGIKQNKEYSIETFVEITKKIINFYKKYNLNKRLLLTRVY
jgi:hypothetical protein